MKINNFILLLITYILVFSFVACKKDDKDVYKCRIINGISKEPLRYYPVKFLEKRNVLFGPSYNLLEEKLTDNNGYVVFTKEKFKSSGIMDSEPSYVIETGYEDRNQEDSLHKFFNIRNDVKKNEETTTELNPRGVIKFFIDTAVFKKYYFNNVDVTNKYGTKTFSINDLKIGAAKVYTDANKTTRFVFKLKAVFFDTLIIRDIYVSDYYSSSDLSYIITK